MINRRFSILCLTLSLIFVAGIPEPANAQDNNVIIIVMDGAGWIHTFGAGNEYIPHLYDDMRPLGTLYTDFRIDSIAGGQTFTNPGHATITTGTWQNILNNGTQRPTLPTIFEYYRKHLPANQNTCYVITGKTKLNILTYSDSTEYGEAYGATWLGGNFSDTVIFNNVVSIMDTVKPNLLLVNFADVDHKGDAGDSVAYVAAIRKADSLIYKIWQLIQTNIYGYNINNTTLFITNDHGRNDTIMTEHGNGCEGCTHIMLLALGRNVVPQQVDTTTTYQRDIAPTVGDLLGFPTPFAEGQSLFAYSDPLPVELRSFTSITLINSVLLKWETESEVNNYGFEIERQAHTSTPLSVTGWKNIGFVNGNGNSNSPKSYSFTDKNPVGGSKFSYRLKQIDNDGQYEFSNIIEIALLPYEYALYQNYPNPFNPTTMIKFSIPEKSRVTIKVFNMIGEEVKEIVNQDYEPGNYNVELNATDLVSGVYLYRLQSNNFTSVKKLMLIK